MIRLLLLVALLLSVSAQAADNTAKLSFDKVSVVQLASVVYGDILQRNYVIHPALIGSDKLVTVHFRDGMSPAAIASAVGSFLDSVGMAVEDRGTYLFVRPAPEKEKAAGDDDVFVYRPKFRSVGYIIDLCGSLFTSGRFSTQRSIRSGSSLGSNPESALPRAVDTGTSAYSLMDRSEPDAMVFSGPRKEVQALQKLLPQLDVPAGEVIVKAVVYEVIKGKSDGTAVSLAVNVLGGRFGVSYGDGAQLANAVTFKSANIDAAFAALASDTRFKAISTPRLRVRSGSQARLTVGQDVPTLGAVSYPQSGGQAVQSVEYKSAGVIFGISPQIRDVGIDLHLDQQISDFARTETGVNNSPTLTKRSFSTDVTLADGELVVLGGLTQDRDAGSRSGLSFLPRWFDASSSTNSNTEIVLMLQVDRVMRAD